MKHKKLYMIVCVVIIFACAVYISSNTIEKYEDKKRIDVVVARYAESLDWLCCDYFKNAVESRDDVIINLIIYNKGEDFTLPTCIPKKVNVIVKKLDNVGRCDHTYLYHICQNYSSLADVIIFLPGSCDMDYKLWRTRKVLSHAISNVDSAMICNDVGDVKKRDYDLHIDYYLSSNGVNAQKNKDSTMQFADVRPFGKWFEHVFGKDKVTKCVTWYGIFATSRNDVLHRPLKFYQMLLGMVDKHNNPEVGHYLERSWFAIFNPERVLENST